MLIRIGSHFCTPCESPGANCLFTPLFPPRDQKAYRRRILDEVLQERVPLRTPRRNTRGVKRKMSGYEQMRQRASQPCSRPIVQIVK
jgi:hypothetical protein